MNIRDNVIVDLLHCLIYSTCTRILLNINYQASNIITYRHFIELKIVYEKRCWMLLKAKYIALQQS